MMGMDGLGEGSMPTKTGRRDKDIASKKSGGDRQQRLTIHSETHQWGLSLISWTESPPCCLCSSRKRRRGAVMCMRSHADDPEERQYRFHGGRKRGCASGASGAPFTSTLIATDGGRSRPSMSSPFMGVPRLATRGIGQRERRMLKKEKKKNI